MMTFENRRMAGHQLAEELHTYADSDAVVVGITRGGMVVAHEVARALHLPLDALVVQYIGEPGRPHLHLGVVVEPDHLAVNRRRLRALALPPEWLEQAVAQGTAEVCQRGAAMRGRQGRRALRGHPVIVVDDSAATGATLRAAVRAIQSLGASKIIVAVPVAPLRVIKQLARRVAGVVCLATPGTLIFEHLYYPQPGEVTDADIAELLTRTHGRSSRRLVSHGVSGALAGAPSP